MKEQKKTVRVASFEVKSVAGDWKDANRRWFSLMEQCRLLTNFIYQTWLVWHVQNGSADKLKAWLNERAEYKAETESLKGMSREEKKERRKELVKPGPCPVLSVPPELAKTIRDGCTSNFPHVHARVSNLVQQATLKSLNGKSQVSILPKHSAILLCHESVPTARRDVPIRFDRQNAKIESPETAKDNFHICLNVWRLPRDGKMATSVQDRIELHCQSRRVRSQVVILKRIVSGEYEFKGSNLLYLQKKRKWIVELCYTQPKEKHPELDEEKTAVLVPAANHPWSLYLPGKERTDWLIGRGEMVAEQRRRIFLQRRSRSNYHKNANSNRKGHGRSRAQNWRWKLQQAWLNFVKKTNHVATSRVVQHCLKNGIGKLIYYQAAGSFAESRFLATAGKDLKWNDATTWEFYQVGTMLKYKCERAGIQCEVRKTEEGGSRKPSVAA